MELLAGNAADFLFSGLHCMLRLDFHDASLLASRRSILPCAAIHILRSTPPVPLYHHLDRTYGCANPCHFHCISQERMCTESGCADIDPAGPITPVWKARKQTSARSWQDAYACPHASEFPGMS